MISCVHVVWCGEFLCFSDKINEMQQFLMFDDIGRLEDFSSYMSISRE